ncbi:unnamed protein product, partial [Didymodactylos carnosus]
SVPVTITGAVAPSPQKQQQTIIYPAYDEIPAFGNKTAVNVNAGDGRKRSHSLIDNFHPVRWIRSHTITRKSKNDSRNRAATISSELSPPLTIIKEPPIRSARSVTISSDPLAPTPRPAITFFY